ncbi:MAG: ABC-F family ATP-binding cassette domain-containing protein [Bacteroidales bacterium]|jgi:ATP-binding cassette subfamily F protein 3|nr:ABC-F family ATP-binding cassette domain-containing protein [Bacteroidales bacterium]MDD4214352.1 ABC-F family ATP-binding cassette domain-containing protein [Bacteroidales bacterium]
MISVNQLSIHFSGEYIFDNISFLINPRDRIGLVGKNGAGKTTLLRILAGLIEPEKGSVAYPTGTKIGYLPQELQTGSTETVFGEALKAFSYILELQAKINKLTHNITIATDVHSQEYIGLINTLNDSVEKLKILGGDTFQVDTEKVLLGLGFETIDFQKKMSEFSGGWQMRVEIAKLLLQQPDLLLLDEPTNHLDIESLQWMEEFLINYKGAVMLVSHDRAFLDNVTKRTIEISLGNIFDYNASYSAYIDMRAERLDNQLATYNNQQRQIEQIERFIERFRYKATKARQVQSRVKMLKKIIVVEIDETDASAIRLVFPKAPPSGKVVIELSNASKSYNAKSVLEKIDLTVSRGEKIAFVGRNGEGKTTLVKMLLHQVDFDGKFQLGHNVIPAYYAQNQTDLLDMEKTVFQTIDDVATGDMRPKVRALLGSFLFGGDTIDKKVKVLSGGEKSRLALAKMLLTPVNLLVMDEPTNHLDMISKDILKNALIRFDGTLIIVSHDRDFLQGLTQKVYEFRNKKIKEYLGDIYYFLDTRKINSLKELEMKKVDGSVIQKTVSDPDNKILREKKKTFEREQRRLMNKINSCEQDITVLEQELAQIDSILTDPEKYKDALNDLEIYTKYQKIKTELKNKMDTWETLHKELEMLKV